MNERKYCVFDNPRTMCREAWIDGHLIVSITAEQTRSRYNLDPLWETSGMQSWGDWGAGKLQGDKDALPFNPNFIMSECFICHAIDGHLSGCLFVTNAELPCPKCPKWDGKFCTVSGPKCPYAFEDKADKGTDWEWAEGKKE